MRRVSLLALAIVFAVVPHFDAMAACEGYSNGSCKDYSCAYGKSDCICNWCEADPSASGLCNTAVNANQCYIGLDKDNNLSYVEGDACTSCVMLDPPSGGDPGGGDPGDGGGGGDPGPDNEDPGCGWWEWWC
jgi:hypothetical protein